MGNDFLFSPTDVFHVPAGVPLLKSLVDQGLEEAMRDRDYLESFLAFNRISGLNVKFTSDTIVLGHRSDLIHSENKHRMRSLYLFYFQFKKLGLEERIEELEDEADVLDIGAGYGRALSEIHHLRPDLRLTGISLPGEKFSPDLNIKEIDLNQSALPDETSDLIYSRNSLRYLQRKDIILEDIYRRLKPGGTAFVDIQLLEIEGQSLRDFFNEFSGIFQWDENTLSLRIDKIAGKNLILDLKFLENKSIHSAWDKEKLNHHEAGWMSVFGRNS